MTNDAGYQPGGVYKCHYNDIFIVYYANNSVVFWNYLGERKIRKYFGSWACFVGNVKHELLTT